MSSKEKWNKGREFFSITSRSSFLRAKLRRVGGFFFRGGGNPTDWNVLGGGKIVLHRTRYSNLVGWFSRRGGIIEARGGAARIKASCGIKNLCNQLSNLLPHISRPMSRPPLSLSLFLLADPPAAGSTRLSTHPRHFLAAAVALLLSLSSLSSPSQVEPLSASCTASRREETL